VRNPWVAASLALCVVLVLVALYVPQLSEVLRLRPPSAIEWVLILSASGFPLIAGQLIIAVRGHLQQGEVAHSYGS